MRTAIFGGTFDPIHSAHLVVAHEAAEAFALDRVLFIPAANPPHKEAGAPYEDRYRMVELACAADPRFLPSRLEEGRAGTGPSGSVVPANSPASSMEKSYSIHTIERLRALEARTGPSGSVVPASSEPRTGPSGSVAQASSEAHTWPSGSDVQASSGASTGPSGSDVRASSGASTGPSGSDVRASSEARTGPLGSVVRAGSEEARTGPSGSVVRASSEEDTLFFIIGADAFADIRSWRRWEDVVAGVEFIVVTRPGHVYDSPPGARVQPAGDHRAAGFFLGDPAGVVEGRNAFGPASGGGRIHSRSRPVPLTPGLKYEIDV